MKGKRRMNGEVAGLKDQDKAICICGNSALLLFALSEQKLGFVPYLVKWLP
jgi:hypothetical protein